MVRRAMSRVLEEENAMFDIVSSISARPEATVAHF